MSKNDLISKKIDELIDKGRNEFLQIFMEAIRFQTVNPPGNEAGLASFLTNKLRAEEIDVQLQEVLPGRPNALGFLKFGKGGRRLLFNSHMDVVPAGTGNWNSEPFEPVIKDGKLYGRGAADDKGGLISMLIACLVLKRINPDIDGELVFCGVMGEETGGIGTKYWVEEGGRVDAAVIGEPSKLEIVVAHRGAYRPTIRFFGKTAHSSEPSQGENAIYYASNFISGVHELNEKLKAKKHPLTGSPTIAVTVFNGGVKINVIPDVAEVSLDRRLSPGERLEEVRQEFIDLLNDLQKHNKIGRWEFGECTDNKGAGVVAENEEIVQNFQRVLRRRNYNNALMGMRATTDMYLLTDVGIPTLIFGPGDMAQAHTPNEHIPVEEVFEAAKIYAEVALNYFEKT